MNQNKSKRQYWDEQMILWKASGLSGERYCKENQFSYASFCYYRGRYHAKPEAKERRLSSGFVALNLPLAPSSDFTLLLPNGMKVLIPTVFDSAGLKRLMEVLRSC